MRTLLILLIIVTTLGCASVKYEKLVYEDGVLVSAERGRYDRFGDQKIKEASVPGAYVKGQEATSEMAEHITQGLVEGAKLMQ